MNTQLEQAARLALEALKLIDEAMPFPVAKLAQAALRAALEQPAQDEPVAWMIWTHGPVLVFMNKDEANLEFDRLNHAYPEPARMLVPLYTRPQAREWVGLTDEEKVVANQMWRVMDADGFIQAIEAKLKEKNT